MAKPHTVTIPDTTYLKPESQKRLADRLARIEGHVRSIRQMIVDQRCADDILLQTAAVKAALSKFASELVDQELRACVETCMQPNKDGVDARLDRLTSVLSTLLKQN